MSSLVRYAFVALFGIAATLLVGCAGAPKYDVVISPDAALKAEATPPSIAVDVIALPSGEASAWRAMSMNQYWSAENQLRKSKQAAIKQFTFGPGHMVDQSLSGTDKIWDTWKGADTLLVLARLPGGGSSTGDQDGRRLALPLDKSRWDQDTIRIGLSRATLRADTMPKPEKK